MKIFDAMSDTSVQFFSLALQLILGREYCRRAFAENGIMTIPEIHQFINASGKGKPVHDMRRWLNKIVASLEEYDKRNANIDTLNHILARIEFVRHIVESNNER